MAGLSSCDPVSLWLTRCYTLPDLFPAG